MADAIVTFLLENLTRLLAEEVNLLSGVEGKINSLTDELKFIDIFLKSSEGKRSDQVVKQVMSQIIDVTHKAEDAIDTYMANVNKQRSRNILEKLLSGKDHVKTLHKVDAEIENIKRRIKEIYENKDKYGIEEGEFQSGDTEVEDSLHKRRRNVEEEEVVGFMHDSEVVIEQLMEMDPCRKVVSIIGMGGLGKTTLARKIYNNDRVKGSFSCRAWGYVSNDYRARELLLSLLKDLLPKSDYKDLFKEKEVKDEDKDKDKNKEKDEDLTIEEKLKKKVRTYLNRKKYLVVLDDIWKTEVWDEIQDAFPDDRRNGSRILITTRIKDVASYTRTKSPYYLPLLNKEESWELFSKKVFCGEECPSDLEPVGRSIAEGCRGLPLAIIVLAGLLAKKDMSTTEWSKIQGRVTHHLNQDDTIVRDILKLSYDSLPRRLKPCFLYFGIYPEDFEIPVRELIRLWIAEGLIQPQGTGVPNSEEPEQVADNYLDELVDRSLVQVASRRTDGGVKTCRIHDLLRDLCISESKTGKFLEVCTVSNIRTLSNPRRLSVHCETEFYVSSTQCSQSCTRSLMFFPAREYRSNHMVKWIVKNFKLVRVLDFGQVRFYSLPGDLKMLIHLRYLKIHSYDSRDIPDCIGSLWNLETLDVKGLSDNAISSGMWKLKRLRHLYITKVVRLPAYSKTMWSLQTLSNVPLDSRTMSLVNNDKFPKLRKLCLWHDSIMECSVREQLQSLSRLSNLHALKIDGTSDLPLDKKVFPPTLTKITLRGVFDFNSTVLNTLGLLDNLKILKLKRIHVLGTCTFICDAGGFLQLQVFQMQDLSVKKWILNDGAMRSLQRVVIQSCDSLTELPEELWSLTSLRAVQVFRPSAKLRNSLQNVEVKNGCKLIIE